MTSSCSFKLLSSSSKLSLKVLNTLKCGMSTQVIVSNKEQLRGIFPSISTPFKRSQSEAIAWKDLQNNLMRWSKIPFTGYLVNGFYSEYHNLTDEERIDVLKMVKSVSGNRKTIMVGSKSESLKTTLLYCESMKRHGANYVLLFAPHFYKQQMSYLALLQFYIKVADQSPLPILLHSMPSLLDLPPELIIDLADHPNIVGMKECSPSIAKFALICDKIRQKSSMDDFSMLTGSSSILLDALKIGATGSICALANVFGHELVQIYDMFNSNHGMPTVNAQLIQNKLVQIDFALNEVYGVAGLKALLDMYGYYGGPCRLPLLDLNEKDLNTLKIILEQNALQSSEMSNELQTSIN